jgi:hypothetical protein
MRERHRRGVSPASPGCLAGDRGRRTRRWVARRGEGNQIKIDKPSHPTRCHSAARRVHLETSSTSSSCTCRFRASLRPRQYSLPSPQEQLSAL